MRKNAAEPYRDIDFSRARKGRVLPASSKKTKISIELDTKVVEFFKSQVERAAGGDYQALINQALLAHIQQGSILEVVRKVVREELKRVA